METFLTNKSLECSISRIACCFASSVYVNDALNIRKGRMTYESVRYVFCNGIPNLIQFVGGCDLGIALSVGFI